MNKIIWILFVSVVFAGGLALFLLRSDSATSGSQIGRETTTMDLAEDVSTAEALVGTDSQETKAANPVGDLDFEPKGESIPAPVLIEYAPDFTLTSLDGTSTFTLSSFRGDKPVIVDFFAEHCPNCRRNLPKMEKLAAQYSDQVEVILIGIDSESATKRYFANRPTTLPLVMQDNRVARNYQLRFTNTKALVNRDGSLRSVLHGQDIEEAHFLGLIDS